MNSCPQQYGFFRPPLCSPCPVRAISPSPVLRIFTFPKAPFSSPFCFSLFPKNFPPGPGRPIELIVFTGRDARSQVTWGAVCPNRSRVKTPHQLYKPGYPGFFRPWVPSPPPPHGQFPLATAFGTWFTPLSSVWLHARDAGRFDFFSRGLSPFSLRPFPFPGAKAF